MFKNSILLFLVLICSNLYAQMPNGTNVLANKYLLHAKSSCAGWRFIGSDKIERYDEIYCARGQGVSYTGRVIWLNKNQFAVVYETGGAVNIDKERPPPVHLMEVVSGNKKTIKLKTYWTGWNNYSSEIEEFKVKAN